MPDIEVYCTVSNCHYWDHGNRCAAERILITLDRIGDRYPEDVDAQQVSMIVDEVGTTPAESCMETCCKTFRPRS
ncbi:MAG: DUF1540 domain-containing protein [Thermaerobacter sp.]|nr:MAG: DUF1540 domain-containing protein [Bacillota bacterium]